MEDQHQYFTLQGVCVCVCPQGVKAAPMLYSIGWIIIKQKGAFSMNRRLECDGCSGLGHGCRVGGGGDGGAAPPPLPSHRPKPNPPSPRHGGSRASPLPASPSHLRGITGQRSLELEPPTPHPDLCDRNKEDVCPRKRFIRPTSKGRLRFLSCCSGVGDHHARSVHALYFVGWKSWCISVFGASA